VRLLTVLLTLRVRLLTVLLTLRVRLLTVLLTLRVRRGWAAQPHAEREEYNEEEYNEKVTAVELSDACLPRTWPFGSMQFSPFH